MARMRHGVASNPRYRVCVVSKPGDRLNVTYYEAYANAERAAKTWCACGAESVELRRTTRNNPTGDVVWERRKGIARKLFEGVDLAKIVRETKTQAWK